MYHHLVGQNIFCRCLKCTNPFKNTRRVLGTRSKQSNENSSESSECNFWILLDSITFFQDKFSAERVKSSKMSTLVCTPWLNILIKSYLHMCCIKKASFLHELNLCALFKLIQQILLWNGFLLSWSADFSVSKFQFLEKEESLHIEKWLLFAIKWFLSFLCPESICPFQLRFCIKKACFFHELVQWFFLQAMLFIDIFIPLHDYFGSFSLLK